MGKPYEPFGRADRGRAYKPDLFRLYSDEVLVMRMERREWGQLAGKSTPTRKLGGAGFSPYRLEVVRP